MSRVRAIWGIALAVTLLLLPAGGAAASPSRARGGAADVGDPRGQTAYRAERTRATRLAEVLFQEEQARRRRHARRARAGAGRPAAVAAPARGESLAPEAPAADAGLDAVFGPADTASRHSPARDYPAAIVSGPGPFPAAAQVGGDSPPPASPESPGPATPRVPGVELFHRGYSSYSQGDYQQARLALARFRDLNPGHDLSDNAQYWIGECYAAEGRWEAALAAYRVVLDHFPFGDKVADSLLKSGYVLLDLGRLAEARRLLEQVTEEFPGTGPARRAAEHLSRIAPE